MIRLAQTTVQFRANSRAAEATIIALWLVFLLVYVVAGVKIVSKAGYSGWWILVAFVPVLNVVMFLVFAFSTWPVHRELEALRAAVPGTAEPPSGSETEATATDLSTPPPPPPPPTTSVTAPSMPPPTLRETQPMPDLSAAEPPSESPSEPPEVPEPRPPAPRDTPEPGERRE